MQAVDLNLATRPFRNDTLVWVGLLLSLSLVGYATWWNVNSYLEHRLMLVDLERRQVNIGERMDELERRDAEAVRRIGKYNLGEIGVKSFKANNVIRFKAFSWTRLFNLLQDVLPNDVQMTSIHPVFRGDVGRSRVTVEDPETVPVSVEGVAKSLKDLLELERSLIRSEYFRRVDPEHYAVDEHTREVVFRMRFLYDPRVPSETEALMADGSDDEGRPADAEPVDEGAAGEPSAATDAPPTEATATRTPPPRTVAEEIEPSGALASDTLKKIDRRGRGKRAAKQEEPAPGAEVQPEAQARSPLPEPTAPAQDDDEGGDRR